MLVLIKLFEKNLDSAGISTNKIEGYTSNSSSEDFKVNHKAFNYDDAEEILNVKHLKQFFRYGHGDFKYTKAVHDISFKVYKGEVFGLVGESGCGKTTTGRSIIKLYKITSGDVWFKGVRIAAGTRWNEKEIKYTNIRLKKAIKDLNIEEKARIAELNDSISDPELIAKETANIKNEIQGRKEELVRNATEICKTQRAKIIAAKDDDKNCDVNFRNRAMTAVKEKYADVIAKYEDEKANNAISEETSAKYEEFKKELANAKLEKITSKMQMIFQDPIASLNPRMNVGDIISEGLVIKGIKNKEYIRRRVAEMLELVGLLPEHMTRYPHEFSGGQRQRIGIARALIMDPELIIADEPVSALDVSIQAQVINLLNDLREKFGLTILFIAHNLSVVKYFCDRIAVMYFGKIVELTTSEELFAHPLHPYTKSLLSAVPTPDPNIEKGRVRIKYNPAASHDYSVQKPTLREVAPNHFVLCNDAEEAAYKEELKK